MGDLTPNFSRHEFVCPCCGLDFVDYALVTLLQEIRDDLGVPIDIISGTRCKAHNASLPGSAPNSYHLKGQAADITARSIPFIDLYLMLDKKYPGRLGLRLYANEMHGLHIDVRKHPHRFIDLGEDYEDYFATKAEELGNGRVYYSVP